MQHQDSDERLEFTRALLGQLEQILSEETAALLARDVDALLTVVAIKRRTLGEIARKLSDVLPPDQGFATAPPGSADPARAELSERLRRCRALNDAAGGAIAALRHDTDNALGLLGIESASQSYGETRLGPGRTAGRKLAIG